MSRMRAKFKVTKVENRGSYETLTFLAVRADVYGPNGESENSDFARWTPWGEIKLGVTNPDLIGKLNEGESYYVDFTKAD